MRQLSKGILALLAVTWLIPPVAAGQAAVAVPSALQGRWVVTGAEHEGKPMPGLNGGVMTVTDETFEIRTASGNLLRGTLKVDASRKPAEFDFLHADGARWEAIYEITAGTLRLNYVESGGKDKRPTDFTTSAQTEASVVTLRREAR
jgi:uncharacterized protein (TIGR03067 family)